MDAPDRTILREPDERKPVEIIPELPKTKTSFAYGMSEEEYRICEAIAAVLKDQQFTIGQFCERTGLLAQDCVHAFERLHAIGVVRCPINDGGCGLYQLVPDLVRRLNARTDR